MSDIEQINQTMFQGVFDIIQDLIEEEWEQVNLYIENDRDSSAVRVIYKNTAGEYVDLLDKIDSRLYAFNVIMPILNVVRTAKSQLPEKQQWVIFYLTVDNTGDMNVSFDYADGISEGDRFEYCSDKQSEWSARYGK